MVDSLQELAFADRSRNALDFSRTALFLLKAQGSLSQAAMLAQQGGASSRIVTSLKAAVPANLLTDDVGDFGILSAGFVASLSTSGAFDAVRTGGAIRLPISNPAFRASTVALTGDISPENTWRPVSTLTVAPGQLITAWSTVILVATAELLDNAAGAVDLFNNELRRATVAGVDRAFLAELANGAATVSATSSVLADISSAADAMSLDSSARLILIAPTTNVRHLGLAALADGRKVYPELTVNGGRIGGVQIIPSDNLPLAGSPADQTGAVLVDASQVAVADGALQLDTARNASLQMADAPSAGAQPAVSLWQTNSRALRVRRRIGYARLRSTAAAVIDGPDW